MPVSEDEFERPVQAVANPTPLSKAEQRKNNKPIMEKRRRARINHCLNELKTLILDAMKKDPARHSKLEKADILEMTVKHLQSIQRQQLATAVATDPSVIMRFKSGFDECAAEVSRYISRLEGVDSGVKQRLTAHLHRCVSGLHQVSAFPQHQNIFATLAQNCDKSSIVLPPVPSLPGDVNNNSNQNGDRLQFPTGLHLIPSRLPTGELALLVPNSNHISTFLNAPSGATFQFPPNTTVGFNSVLTSPLGGTLPSNFNHASAFTAVNKSQDYPSPTSTADIVKKEPNLPQKDDPASSAYLNHQTYNSKVTDNPHAQDHHPDDSNSLTPAQHSNDLPPNYNPKYNPFPPKYPDLHDAKITQTPTSTSFQKNLPDSTTSAIPAKPPTPPHSGFKPFQVDIPNTHFKAHISISRNHNDNYSPPLHIPQNPNPKAPQNPTQMPSKPQTCDSHAAPPNQPTDVTRAFTPQPPTSSTTPEPQIHGKRPLPSASPDPSSPKVPRISLNVTLTEDHPPKREFNDPGNRCKRISVIVEDSSKSAARDNAPEVGSSQRDMWRPW